MGAVTTRREGMKHYTTKKMREIADTIPQGYKLPQDVVKKYNLIHEYSSEEKPGGRAWIMWFLDLLDERGEG